MDNASAARAERDSRIVELRALGWTHKAIAQQLHCSRQLVSKILNPSARDREREYRQANAERIKARDADYRRRNAEYLRERSTQRRRDNVAQKASYDRRYRRANADRITEYQVKYRQENAEKLQEAGRGYRKRYGDQIRERKRQRWAENAEEINAQRRARYGDADRERLRQYRNSNLEASRAVVARRKMRAVQGMDALGRLLSVEYRKAIANDPCAYCGEPGEHDDHKLPLARGGTDHWWNLHRTCKECNFRKHTMTHEEFLTSGRMPSTAA